MANNRILFPYFGSGKRALNSEKSFSVPLDCDMKNEVRKN